MTMNENPNNHTTLCQQEHGDSGNKKLPLNRKEEKPGLGRGGHVLRPVGGKAIEIGQKTQVTKAQFKKGE